MFPIYLKDASIITNTSSRKVSKILNLSINNSKIPSKSTIFYNASKILKSVKDINTLKNDLLSYKLKFCLHFDGKRIIGYDGRKIEKVAVCISGENYGRLIALRSLNNRKGRTIYDEIANILEELNLNDQIALVICNTTSANTGKKQGVITFNIYYN
ncbi:hypothetical protein A3Q56_08003 [Intoshia linei]|uniref:Uncharacterized protein n=1 Tax=Intoshia linei TaxID=1819745 RepID=A0A177AQK1_9BILA|nr:hypothetical protein A3Q56_08003 [Intoshia linei]